LAKLFKFFFLIRSIFLGTIIILGTIFIYQYLNNFNLFSSIDSQVSQKINDIENLPGIESFYFELTNANLHPINLGSLQKNGAYFSVEFSFKGGIKNSPQNLFQTAAFNNGIRLEHFGDLLSIVYSTNDEKKYRVVVLESKLQSSKKYKIKIDALNHAFIRIDLNGKIKNFTFKEIDFLADEFLLGSGFDPSRVYQGSLQDVRFRKINISPSPSFINKFLYKDLNISLNRLWESFISIGLFLAIPIFFILRICNLKN
jgi:hypothetical protein